MIIDVLRKHDYVAARIRIENNVVTKSWNIAEFWFNVWLVIIRENVIFWRLCWLSTNVIALFKTLKPRRNKKIIQICFEFFWYRFKEIHTSNKIQICHVATFDKQNSSEMEHSRPIKKELFWRWCLMLNSRQSMWLTKTK